MKLTILAIVLGMLSGCKFQSKGLDSIVAQLSSHDAVCGSILKSVFDDYYHRPLSTNCNLCHSTAHGAYDDVVAYNAFMRSGEELIFRNGTSDNHAYPNTGSHVEQELTIGPSEWEEAQVEFDECIETELQSIMAGNENEN